MQPFIGPEKHLLEMGHREESLDQRVNLDGESCPWTTDP